MPLPDVPQSDYDAFTANRFTQQTNERINQSLSDQANFLRSSSQRIATLTEPVEIASSTSPIITAPSPPPVWQPPQVPQLPPLPIPPLPGLPQLPGQAPTPIPAPPGAPPRPGIQPLPGIPPRPPLPVAPQVPPATRPAGAVAPIAPMAPGPIPLPPTTRPPTWAQPAPPAQPTFADQVDTSAPAVAAVNAAPAGDLQNYARQAATRAGIDPTLFMAQIQQESGFNPNAGSPAGAQGIAQIVPRYHPGVDPSDPYASLDYAANLMRRLLDQYGGDWQRALVAYNGGSGAVAAWDSGSPYQESQTYVRNILGRGRPSQTTAGPVAASSQAQPVATAMAVSQFGDRELSAAEAYAACGPAAAVRFAQAYGRNPSLKEALELARSVGWTEQAGMAGIASEQALMQKLGLDTRLVAGRDWAAIAREAQTGNPVTISTPGHYFYADGFNPDTGAFHVGRSGLDLRQGKEWMTPAEMEGLMGPAQGALFANNPNVSASSSTVEGTTRSLDDTRKALSAQFGAPVTPIAPSAPPISAQPYDPQVQQLENAVEMAYIPQTRRPVEQGEAPQSAAAGPAVLAAGAPPPGPPGGGPFDQIGRAIADALRSALGGGGPPRRGGGPDYEQEDQPDQQTAEPGVLDRSGQMIRQLQTPVHQGWQSELPPIEDHRPDVWQRTRDMIERLQTLPGGFKLGDLVGAPDLLPPDTRNMSAAEAIREAIDRAGQNTLRMPRPSPGPGGLGIFDPRFGSDPRMDIPDLIEPIGRAVGKAGDILGAVTGASARAAERAAGALETSFELGRAAPVEGVVAGIARRGARSAGEALDRNRWLQAWDSLTRQLTDSNVDLNHIEQEFAKRLGRPLTDSERVGLLARFDPTHQAETIVENTIGPALRDISPEAMQDFEDLVKYRTGRSAAEGQAKLIEQEVLEGGIAPRTEQRLKEALAGLDEAQTAYGEALKTRREVAAGTRRTAESISMDAANRRVADAQAAFDAATEAARHAQVAAAAERVTEGPAGRLIRIPEQRDLILAEDAVNRLNRRYEAMWKRNAENPRLPGLARQIGYAEDRLQRVRTAMGETVAAREARLGERAAAAGTAAGERPTVTATPELAAARVRLRYEQRNLERLQRAAERGEKGLTDDLARAWRRVDRAQRDVDVATADLPESARAQAWAQLTGRQFEGLSYDELGDRIAQLEAKYADQPETWAKFERADAALQDLRQQMLDERVNAGMMDDASRQGLLDTYSHWTPFNSLEYMTDERPGMGLARGGRFNVRDPGIRSYTPEGSTTASENHVAAMIREAYSHYNRIAKNNVAQGVIRAQGVPGGALRKIADTVREYTEAGGAEGPLLHPDYKLKANERPVVAMIDGKRQEYVTDNPLLKQAIENAGSESGTLAKLLQLPAHIVRETAIQRNPLFLPVNLARDAFSYAVRETGIGGPSLRHPTRGLPGMAINLGPAALTAAMTSDDDPHRGEKIGGALALGVGTRIGLGRNLGLGPSAARAYLRNFGDVLSGLGTGRMTGENVQNYFLAGGGMRGGGVFSTGQGPRSAEEALRRLTRRNTLQVRNIGDLKQLLSDVAGFGWSKALGDRLELVGRTASYEQALARGETPLQAAMRGRDASVDFNRGGNLTRELNRYIPFFNVGFQAPAQLYRLARENPLGALFAGTVLLGNPASATEAWNYSDPQRAKDYEDVPNYLKSLGVVIMLPGEAPRDANGNRVPQKIFIPLPQEFMPFVTAGREAYKRISGKGTPLSAGETAGQLATELSPLRVGSPEATVGGMIPAGPGTAMQLQQNRDWFRGSTIANQFSDENASNLGKTLAPVLERAVNTIPGFSSARIRPSQVDFAIRDTANGLGSTGLNITDALSGRGARVPGTASELPVVGSVAGRFVRGTGGQSWEDVRQPEQLMAADVRSRLRELGDYYEPSLVPAEIQKIPLRREEQVDYQQLTNQYFNERIRRALASPRVASSEVVRARVIRQVMDQARARAARDVLAQIRRSGSSLAQRRRQQSAAL